VTGGSTERAELHEVSLVKDMSSFAEVSGIAY
jgi:hypothetical protein